LLAHGQNDRLGCDTTLLTTLSLLLQHDVNPSKINKTLFTTGHLGIVVKICHCGVSGKVSDVPPFL